MSEGPAPEIALTSDQRRSRRKHAVRPKTISVKRMTKRELEVGRALFPETNHPRPRTRAECADGPRPCPYVSCKYHLYLDVLPRTGAIKLNFPDLEVEELRESCALDVADREGSTLEEVAAAINTTRERVRQVELLILTRAKQQAPELQEHLGDVRRLPVLPTAPHEDSMKPNLIPQLLAYCASVEGGAKNTSLFSWLKSQHVSRAQAEELLEQLVSEGRLQLVEKPIAGGEVVVRYLPAEAVEPAPLPKSDAPSSSTTPLATPENRSSFEVEKEELSAEEPAPASAEVEVEAPTPTAPMEGPAPSPPALLAEPPTDPILPPPPEEEPVAIAGGDDLDLTTHLLLACSDEQFAAVASARKALAKAHELLQQGREMEERALDELKSALKKKSAAPAPEEPARAPRAPAQGEPREGTVEAAVLAALRSKSPARAGQLTEVVSAEGMTVERQTVAGTLATLARRGLARRLELGLYEAVA